MTKIVRKRETLALMRMPVCVWLHIADSSGVKDNGLEFPHHPTADVRRPKYTLHRSHGPSPYVHIFQVICHLSLPAQRRQIIRAHFAEKLRA